MDLSAELQACLKEFTAVGAIEIRENGGRVAPFSGLSWEVRGASEKPLLHLWSENHNLTRRVLAITDHSDQRLALAVERFGRAKPDRLEFIRSRLRCSGWIACATRIAAAMLLRFASFCQKEPRVTWPIALPL